MHMIKICCDSLCTAGSGSGSEGDALPDMWIPRPSRSTGKLVLRVARSGRLAGLERVSSEGGGELDVVTHLKAESRQTCSRMRRMAWASRRSLCSR